MPHPLLANKSPADIYFMMGQSKDELTSSLRLTARAHGDRIRKLQEGMKKISAAEITDGETLDGIKGFSLSPDMEQLILNPTEGI